MNDALLLYNTILSNCIIRAFVAKSSQKIATNARIITGYLLSTLANPFCNPFMFK